MKHFEKKHLESIVFSFLKKDLGLLPGGQQNDERCVWGNTEIGNGSFKNGFISEVFCKGKELSSLDDFAFAFLKDKVELFTSTSTTLIRTTLLEFAIEIRREFQLNTKGIIPVSKYWVIKHIIEHYQIVHLQRRIEDAVSYKAKLLKEGSEKIKL